MPQLFSRTKAMDMNRKMIKIGLPAIASAVVLTISSHTTGQSAQAVIENPVVRSDDYRTTYLRWSADSGGVYQVESADALATQGMQGLRWVIRETDCAARGTNAEWADFGDVRWIPRVFHPIFQPQRF